MHLSDDMQDLIRLFRKNDVRYAVVGGHAVNYYGYVRNTQDLDLLIEPTPENADRVMAALVEFGFGGAGIPHRLFEQEGGAVHLGDEPNRIDILTSLKNVGNREIFDNVLVACIDDVEVPIISLDHLLAVKRSSARARDLADAEELEKIHGL